MEDKILLRKRAIIETINDELKNHCQVEHTQKRSVNNFMMNYSFKAGIPFVVLSI